MPLPELIQVLVGIFALGMIVGAGLVRALVFFRYRREKP